MLCHLILLERYKMIYGRTDYTKSPSANPLLSAIHVDRDDVRVL